MTSTDQNEKPTVVLVHGAFTGSSVWDEVIGLVQSDRFAILAPSLPLRGLSVDAAYLRSVVDAISGPVILVGHSYGGAVISAVQVTGRLAGLGYVAALQPDTDESMASISQRFPGGRLTPDALAPMAYPGGVELSIRAERFADILAEDVPNERTAVLATTQRPVDQTAITEGMAGTPTWRGRRSRAIVATRDNSLPAEAQRFMAKRAGSTIVEVDSSHLVPIAHPEAVADFVRATVLDIDR